MWFTDGADVRRIDPRTDRVAETIRIGTEGTSGIAVGAGSVWVSAEQQGAVWRIEPGPHPEARSIDVGAGVTYVAFGAGAVWAANYVDGTLSRIDPRTNAVKKIPIGAAQALAAGAGSAWVSTAGGTRTGELPDSVCGEVASGAGKPDVLIASDLPLQGAGGAGRRAMADAIRFVLRSSRSPRGQVHGRIPLLRRLDGPDRRHGASAMRGERERLCALEAARGRDRPVQLELRRDRDPDPEPRPGRAARDDQPLEHVLGAHARRAGAGGGRPPRRAGRVLPERGPQLLPPASRATTCRAPHMPCWRGNWVSVASTCSTTAAASGRAWCPTPSAARPTGWASGSPARRASTRRPRATRRSRTRSRAQARRASCSAPTRSTVAIGS